MISMEMLQDARRVLSPVINQTPVLHAPGLVPDCDFYLKADCLQKTGAFKLRGAYYKIATLSDEEKRRGVIACSAGNHAQGVGFASRDMKIPATICIPAGAPISKIQATRSYGANVVLVDGVYDDAYAEAVRLRDEQGLTFIHPFDDYRVMAGQGTIGLEILEQLPDVDVILVPIGGGGLISGLAYAVKHLKPSCQVIGVQAAGAASMVESLEAGHILTLPSVHTIADGIQVKTPGDLTFEMCRQYVDKVVAVSENEIAGAILSVLEKQKLVAEGAGAVGIAAAMRQGGPAGQDRVRPAVRRQCGRDHAGADHHPGPGQGRAHRQLRHGAAGSAQNPGHSAEHHVRHGRERAGGEPRAGQPEGPGGLLRGAPAGGDPGRPPCAADI